MICVIHQILLGSSDEGECEGWGMWVVCGRETGMQGSGGERDHIQDGTVILK